MLTPEQFVFADAWDRRFDGARDLELVPVTGGFAHVPSRTLIHLGHCVRPMVPTEELGWARIVYAYGPGRVESLETIAAKLRERAEAIR